MAWWDALFGGKQETDEPKEQLNQEQMDAMQQYLENPTRHAGDYRDLALRWPDENPYLSRSHPSFNGFTTDQVEAIIDHLDEEQRLMYGDLLEQSLLDLQLEIDKLDQEESHDDG